MEVTSALEQRTGLLEKKGLLGNVSDLVSEILVPLLSDDLTEDQKGL